MIDNAVDKKLLKKLRFSPILDRKIDLALIDLKSESMEGFVSAEIERILGFDDDIVSSLVMNMLNGVSDYGVKSKLDPRKLQVTLTPFLQAHPASKFVETLWRRLLKEQESKMKQLTTSSSSQAETSQSEDAREAKKELVIPLNARPAPPAIKQESGTNNESGCLSESVNQKVQEALAKLSAKVKQESDEGIKNEEIPMAAADTEVKKRKRRWDEK